MPVELCLELVSPVGSDRMDAKRKFVDHVIDESDGMRLIVTVEDLESSHTGGVIYGGVLKSTNILAFGCFECDKLNIHLHVVTRDFLGITACMECSPVGILR